MRKPDNHSVQWPGYRLDDWEIGVRFPVEAADLCIVQAPRPIMGSTLPHSHWVKAGALFLSLKRPGRGTDNASPLVLRLRMCDVTPPQPHMTSSLAQGQLHFTSLSKIISRFRQFILQKSCYYDAIVCRFLLLNTLIFWESCVTVHENTLSVI